MKIGILTFHCAHNYGAILQAYALQETLREMGHDVEVIDYRPEFLLAPYRPFDSAWLRTLSGLNYVRNLVVQCLRYPLRKYKYEKFERFISKYLRLSARVEDIPCDYDAYLIGSDQVWNPVITKGYDSVYFAGFDTPRAKKIAYAASMETEADAEQKGTLRRLLSNFDAISVREMPLFDLVKPLYEGDLRVVLDPTLLASVHILDRIAIKPDITNYVLIYQVRGNVDVWPLARRVASNNGSKPIEIWTKRNNLLDKDKIGFASPAEFLGLIKYADSVVTSSFHGVALSVAFQKEFYAVRLNDGADSRVESLLTRLGIGDRLVDISCDGNLTKIDYIAVKDKLDSCREDSMSFLSDNLKY